MSRKAPALESPKPARVFTVDEANATLPLVRAITSDLVDLSREVVERHQRVEHLKAGRDITSGDPYDDELAQIEEELEKDRRRLHEYVEELRQLGVEPKSGVDGLIDFPSMREGRLIYLCWKLGEPGVGFWHELDAGYAGRQPLANELVTDSSS
jgi:hypothetical protein